MQKSRDEMVSKMWSRQVLEGPKYLHLYKEHRTMIQIIIPVPLHYITPVFSLSYPSDSPLFEEISPIKALEMIPKP